MVNQIEFQGRSFAGKSVTNYGIIKTGYVVYTRSPLKSNPYGIIKTNKGKPGIVSTLYAIYKNKGNGDPNFIQVYFEQDSRTNNYLRPLINKGAKNTIQVSSENALKGKIIFPGKLEQQRISNYFEKLNAFITLHQNKIEAIKKYKAGMLQKMFPCEGETVPEIRFPGFTEEWEKRKFSDIFSFERPDNYTVKQDEYSNDYTMPVLTANKAFILGYTKENSPYTENSIIFDDFTLECKYVDFPYMVKSSAIKILTVKDTRKDDLRFSFERLNTTKIEPLGHVRHYISVVQPTETKTPSLLEQQKIGAFFQTLDNLINFHQREYDKLKELKKGLLQQMFV